MTYKRYSQPQLSAVGVIEQTITKPRLAVKAMAEVVIGAGAGTSSVQLSGSNDGTNFTNIGSAITSTNRAVALSPNNEVFLFYRATTTIATDTKETDVIFYFN